MLGEMLEWAVARRYITWNPARLVKLPKDRWTTSPDAPSVYSTSRAKRPCTRDQYVAVMLALTATGGEAFTTATPNGYFIAMLSIGARPGEIDALRWAGRCRKPDDHHRPCDQASGRRTPVEHRSDQDREPSRRRDDRRAVGLDDFLPTTARAVRADVGRLTPRQREILELIAQGRSNADVATQLHLADKTVRNQVSAIFDQMHVTSRAQAIVRAREAGYGRSTERT